MTKFTQVMQPTQIPKILVTDGATFLMFRNHGKGNRCQRQLSL